MTLQQHIKLSVVIIATQIAVLSLAQGKELSRHLNTTGGGQVTITAPEGLELREINKPKSDDKKVADNKNVENRAEIDDDKTANESVEDSPESVKKTSEAFIANHSVGYRIQAFSDNNYRNAKQSAQARARIISARYPHYRTYLSYKAPRWRLRVGDFKTREDAQKALSNLRSSFPSYSNEFSIVRDRINVWSYDK